MTIDTITREALVEKLKQYPTLLQQFLVLVDTQGTTLDDIQEILKKAEEAESNAVKAQASATIAQEEAEKSSTSASKVDAFDERIINLEKSTAKVKEENTFTQVNNFNSGIKSDKFKTSGGLDIINHDGTNINIGNSSKTLKLTGSQSRPTYKEQDIALLADVNSSLTTAIRYTDTETTERKAQDTALQTNIDKKANTTDLDTLKSSVNSNWSTLMANLGIGRWENASVNDWQSTVSDVDSLCSSFTNHKRCFYHRIWKNLTRDSARSNIIIKCCDMVMGDNSHSYHYCYAKYDEGTNITLMLGNMSGDLYFCFALSPSYVKIDVQEGKIVKCLGYSQGIFCGCSNLEYIGPIDMQGAEQVNGGNLHMFEGCSNLKTIKITHWHGSFDISMSTAFEETDLVEIISNLDPVSTTQTLTMGATNLAKLTDAEKQVATDKGWILA